VFSTVGLLMTLSGFASLVYQIVWTQQLGTWLGHEVAAVLAVVAAFFGGLASGSWALGRCIARSPHPGRWYAALELVIALWGLVLL
jgi:spermidine synthase